MTRVHGIHHVTAIAGDPQENLDFYTAVLGMRLVKRSVNQDAPDTYHFFYADGEGHPGSDLTFFPWPELAPVRKGIGLAVEVALAIPTGSLGAWSERLAEADVRTSAPEARFDERVLPFRDPHGLDLALVETSDPREFAPWEGSPVPESIQIRGLHGVRLRERDLALTAQFLAGTLGFEPAGEEHGWHRFAVEGGGSGRILDVRELPDERRGAWGSGGVHHVAFRVADDSEQESVRRQVLAADGRPTPVIDRFWFRSVYFKEPGGVLFEVATDGPGFAVDEDVSRLGESLVLPPWLEPRRSEIEAVLQPLSLAPGTPDPAFRPGA